MIRQLDSRPVPKCAVFGASGFVGAACVREAVRRGFRVLAIGGESSPPADTGAISSLRLDVTNREAVERLVLEEWPEVVINAAALSNPATVDSQPEQAEAVNVVFPAQLALLTRHLGSKLIHFSTDMVFDGQRGGYRSTDMPSPSSLYGETKLRAEKAVLEGNPADPVVLRITIVTGDSPGGARSVHEKMLHAIRRGEKLPLFADELRQPCSVESVAEVAVELAQRPELHGLFHWGGSEVLSRAEMGRRILARFRIPAENWIEERNKADYPAFADRPSDLSLELAPLAGKLRTRPPSFTDQLARMSVPADLYRWHRDTFGALGGR